MIKTIEYHINFFYQIQINNLKTKLLWNATSVPDLPRPTSSCCFCNTTKGQSSDPRSNNDEDQQAFFYHRNKKRPSKAVTTTSSAGSATALHSGDFHIFNTILKEIFLASLLYYFFYENSHDFASSCQTLVIFALFFRLQSFSDIS